MTPRELLTYVAGAWSGRLMALIPFCRTRAEGRVFLKKRRPEAPWLIACANLYLRWRREGIEVLPEADWHRWEAAMHARVNGLTVRKRPGGVLEIPALPGVGLHTILRSGSDEERLRALAAAFRALRRLHETVGPEGATLTHGDAAAHNACWDSATGAAHWFDFEMRHDSRLPEEYRRAEDVRALAYSACSFLPPGSASLVVRALRRGYPPVDDLQGFLQERRQRVVALQVVQAPFHPNRARALESVLSW